MISPRSFIASAGSVIACGARPILRMLTVTVATSGLTLSRGSDSGDACHSRSPSRGMALPLDPSVNWPARIGSRSSKMSRRRGGTYRGRQLGSVGDIGPFSFCNDEIVLNR